MATFIHGVGASQNIDSSGERIIIEGMDISSLALDGVFTYEHEEAKGPNGERVHLKTPDQVVGKILKAKKIFSDSDCEDDNQLYFWNKIKVPYIYVMGELFDDYKESAKEVAGMFRYDADKKNQNERAVMNFSIEGAYVSKEGIDVIRSIARKCTLTVTPCNKAAFAEMVLTSKKQKNNVDELFKTEGIEIEVLNMDKKSKLWDLLIKKEDPKKHADKLGIKPFEKDELGMQGGGGSDALSGGSPSSAGGLLCSEKNMSKAHPKLALVPKPHPDGKHLGNTTSGKPVYSAGRVGAATDSGFNAADHRDAAHLHSLAGNSGKSGLHLQAATSAERKEARLAAGLKQKQVQNSTSHVVSSKTNSDKLYDPDITGKSPGIKKALEAGSALASPDALVGGAALGKQSLKKDSVNPALAPKDRKVKELQSKIDAGQYKPDAAKIAIAMKNHPEKPLGKDEEPPKANGTTENFSVNGKNTPVGKMIRQKDLKDFKKQPKPNLTKSKWLSKAEEAYQKWEKREQFEQFMAKRMPNLSKGEIRAIGQAMILQKALKDEVNPKDPILGPKAIAKPASEAYKKKSAAYIKK
jgi:hypothetical protein